MPIYNFFFLIALLFQVKCFAQQNIKGSVISENKPIAYALIYSNSIERPVYSDSLGNFELKNITLGNVITVRNIGFKEKEIKVTELQKSIKIELEPVEEVLDEIIINTINSSWQKLFKKPKAHLWTNAVPALEGFSTITKYKAINDIKFNGFAIIVKNDGKYFQKKLRPLIFKDSISILTSLIDSKVEIYKIPKNNDGNLNKKDFRVEFVFNHIIELKKGEEIYIGVEFIPKDIENINLQDNLMLATVKEISNPHLDTRLYSLLFDDRFRANYHKIIALNEDFYFELKVVK